MIGSQNGSNKKYPTEREKGNGQALSLRVPGRDLSAISEHFHIAA